MALNKKDWEMITAFVATTLSAQAQAAQAPTKSAPKADAKPEPKNKHWKRSGSKANNNIVQNHDGGQVRVVVKVAGKNAAGYDRYLHTIQVKKGRSWTDAFHPDTGEVHAYFVWRQTRKIAEAIAHAKAAKKAA